MLVRYLRTCMNIVEFFAQRYEGILRYLLTQTEERKKTNINKIYCKINQINIKN